MLDTLSVITAEIKRLQETPNSIPLTAELICKYASKRLVELEPNILNLSLYYAYDGYDDSLETSGFTISSQAQLNSKEEITLIDFLTEWYLEPVEDRYVEGCDEEGSVGCVKFNISEDPDDWYGLDMRDANISRRSYPNEYQDTSTVRIVNLNFKHPADNLFVSVDIDFRNYGVTEYLFEKQDLVKPILKELLSKYSTLQSYEMVGHRTICKPYSDYVGSNVIKLDLTEVFVDLLRYDPIETIVSYFPAYD